MITTEHIELDIYEKNKISDEISKCKKVLDIKYRRFTVILLSLFEFIILYLIYWFEAHPFSIILKLLTVVPIWMIIMVTYFYYQKRLPSKRLFKLYNIISKANKYPVFRIRPKYCEKYSDGNFDYLLFKGESKKMTLIRLQDFNFNGTEFPTDNFIIPPYFLFDIVGRTISTNGKKIIPIKQANSMIPRYLEALNLLEQGQPLLLDKR